MAKHVIILGCGRSGTSIFGELFESIPGYSYFSEPPFEDVISHGFDEPTAIKVPRESELHPAPPGLSFPVDTLLQAMRETAVLFWQVRHPLDAIASLRPGISNNWGHHPRPPDWQDWLDRPLIMRCAHHWAFLNETGFAQVKDRARVCKFEDMIAQPLDFARRICLEIGVDTATCGPELHAWADRVQNTNNDKFLEASTSLNYSRPDHRVRVGRWKENLSDDDVRAVLPLVAKTAANFDYQMPHLA